MTQAATPSREQWETAQAYTRLFQTPDGRRVLEDLEAEFDDDNPLFGGSPERTGGNIGMLQVLRAIRTKMRFGRLTLTELEALHAARAVLEDEEAT